MELSYIEHIGIAVKDLKKAIKYYEDTLGLKCYSIEEVADQKVKTAFFKIRNGFFLKSQDIIYLRSVW